MLFLQLCTSSPTLLQPISLGSHGLGDNLIQVKVNVLHPHINFKTLPVSESTAAEDVVLNLVEKHGITLQDKNPDAFYLAEVQCVFCLLLCCVCVSVCSS